MRLMILFFSFMLITFNVNAAKITDDILVVGASAAVDFSMVHKDGSFIKRDVTGGQWTFSNDGVIEKAIGSGAGGGAAGFNNLDNSGFEDGITSEWTCTSGKCSEETTSPLFGEKSLKFDPTNLNDNFRSSLKAIPKGLYGNNCEYKATYIGGDEFLSARIVNGDGETLSRTDKELKTHSTVQVENFSFICPTEAAILADSDKGDLYLEVYQNAATAPATSTFDEMYNGENSGIAHTVIAESQIIRYDGYLGNATTAIQFRTRQYNKDSNGDDNSPLMTDVSTGSGTFITAVKKSSFQVSVLINAGAAPNLDIERYNASTALIEVYTLNSSSVTAYMSPPIRMDIGDYISVKTQTAPNDVAGETFIIVKATPLIETQSIVYKVAPKISDVVNTLGASVSLNSGSTIAAIVSDDVSFIDTVSVIAGSRVRVNFKSGTFTVIPLVVSSTVATTAGQYLADASNVSITGMDLQMYNVNGSNVDTKNFNFILRKQGVDFKLPTVQQVLVNQVETGIAEGVRIESCVLSSIGGTPFAVTPDCASWVDTFTDNSAGDTTFNYSNIWPTGPTCTCTVNETSRDCSIMPYNTPPTTTSFTTVSQTTSGTPEDNMINVICIGAR